MSTPNVNAPHGKSPVDILWNRKIRLPLDVIRPTPHSPTGRNTNMGVQFNRHHGAVNNIFIPGQSVLAKDRRGGAEKWTQGRIVRPAGKVVYESLFDRIWLVFTLHVVVRKEPFEEVGRLACAACVQASAAKWVDIG
ncbi:hypothetical protein CSKR_101058 [Clonorchis sinensis]|uniref:Uncharacterized protein n=1 Tax=Clonorchis sinensis TaxID=79923 RepID=A0A3R7CM39_CLOSI|nr:hypothetical protein CSKR_101058 [Clonorchis sinensis]